MLRIRLTALALVTLLACACTARGGQELRLLVVDAETGAPVGGAALDLHPFPSTPEAPEAGRTRAVADAGGELRITPPADPVIWQARASGYVEQRVVGREGAPPARYVARQTEGRAGQIALYRLPAPSLTVTVPEAYSGPLTINLLPAPGFAFVEGDLVAAGPQPSDGPVEPGQRRFEARSGATGEVELTVTPLLYDLAAEQLTVRDGAGPLPWRDPADGLGERRGVWGAISAEDKALFQQIRLFVGVRAP